MNEWLSVITAFLINIHCDCIITHSLGSTGKKLVIADRPYNETLFIVKATSFPGFHIRKQMPHPPSFGMGHQSLYFNGYNTQTINKSWYMYQLSIGVYW